MSRARAFDYVVLALALIGFLLIWGLPTNDDAPATKRLVLGVAVCHTDTECCALGPNPFCF